MAKQTEVLKKVLQRIRRYAFAIVGSLLLALYMLR